MKKKGVLILVSVLICIYCISCKSEKNNTDNNNVLSTDVVKNPATADGKATGKLPKFEFEKETHNFGNVIRGEKVSYSFKFKNVGDADLVISSVTASCGCTTPEYPRTPVSPGQEAYIAVTFDSEGRQGIQNKTITIVANTVPSTKVLKITCNVISPEN